MNFKTRMKIHVAIFGRKVSMYSKKDKQRALGVLWMSLRFNTNLQKYMAEPCRALADKYGLKRDLLLNTYSTLEHEGILTTCRGVRNLCR